MSYTNQINRYYAHENITSNSLLNFAERSSGIMLMADDIVVTGTGDVVINVFKVTGTIRILNTRAEITEVTTLTNLTDLHADVYDGTNSEELTKSPGAVLSGAPVGSFFTKDKATTEVFSVALADQVRIIEATSKNAVPFYVTQKFGTDTYIRLAFSTTDAPVSFKLSIWFEYLPINGGSLVFV